jgi:hypothetical protein
VKHRRSDPHRVATSTGYVDTAMLKVPVFRTIVCWAGAYAAIECMVVVLASLVVATAWPWVALCAAIEGALLGIAQGWLLRGIAGRQLIVAWTAATVAGTLLARGIEFAADNSPPAATILGSPLLVQIAAGALLGAAVGAASGSFQALLLRGTIDRPARWIAVCSAAWAVALPALLAVGVAAEGLSGIPMWRAATALFVLFGAIGALTGAIEGAGLVHLLATPSGRPSEREGHVTRANPRYAHGNGQTAASAHRR